MDADGRGSFMKVFDKAGQTHRIGEKRQALWEVFKAANPSEPILLVMETYNKIEYVADARSIKDDLLKMAVKKMGEKLADAQAEERNRSQALAYAKDMFCAKVITQEELYKVAADNYQFIKGEKPW